MRPDSPFLRQSRRAGLQTAGGIGLAALSSLLGGHAVAAPLSGEGGSPHPPARAKRIIYLFQSGAPSQMDLFDPKP
ncbi:MAG: sulfatase, partial [bacterium]